jgi:hypothetical protein
MTPRWEMKHFKIKPEPTSMTWNENANGSSDQPTNEAALFAAPSVCWPQARPS